MGCIGDRIKIAKLLKNIYLLQEVIFDLCPEEDIEIWLRNGIPDGMEFSDAIDFFEDMPKELTAIYNLAIRLLRGVEL